MPRRHGKERGSVLPVLGLAAFVIAAAMLIASTWFEGAVVDGIAQVLYLIPETLGWVIDSL